jgi:hypothetical protein
MDQHGSDGPTALVETDGSLHITDVLRFGPSITELDEQQRIWDLLIGRVAPTMKPLLDASTIKEEGIAPHPQLWKGEGGKQARSRVARATGRRGNPAGGFGGGGPSRKRSRGDR